MITKVEDLTDEQLDVLVAEKVKGWYLDCGHQRWYDAADDPTSWYAYWINNDVLWRPSTDLACAFQVDKPEWAWEFEEVPHWYDDGWHLSIEIWDDTNTHLLSFITIPLDPANKVAAYCRGRCIAALKACGITEV